MECHSAIARLYLGWGRTKEAHAAHLAAVKCAERLGSRHAAVQKLVSQLVGLKIAAPGYLGQGDLNSRVQALMESAKESSR